MKLWQKWMLGFGIGSAIIMAIFISITVLGDKSWNWVAIPFGILIALAFVLALILVTWYIAKRAKPIIETPINELKEIVINRMKEDTDNPDNFVIIESYPVSTGERGETPTPVVIFDGYGSELEERRFAIINSVKPEKWGFLIEPTEDKIKELITKIADFPSEFIPEEITRKDSFGNVIETIKTQRRPTYAQKHEEEKQKEVEKNIQGQEDLQ